MFILSLSKTSGCYRLEVGIVTYQDISCSHRMTKAKQKLNSISVLVCCVIFTFSVTFLLHTEVFAYRQSTPSIVSDKAGKQINCQIHSFSLCQGVASLQGQISLFRDAKQRAHSLKKSLTTDLFMTALPLTTMASSKWSTTMLK